MNHIGNLTFELCDTEVNGMKYDRHLGGIQKYNQHQRYYVHVLKCSHDTLDRKGGLYDRFALWIEIRKWFKVLQLQSTMDETPFTELSLQEAGKSADRLFKLPNVEGAKHALNELLKEWCGARIITKYEGKDKKRKMLQLKPKYKMEQIPKAPANSIVLLDGTIIHPTPDVSCVWLLPPNGRPEVWAEHHMRKYHEYTKEFQDFFDGLLDRFLDLFSLRKPEMFKEFLRKLNENKLETYERFFPDYKEGVRKLQ